MADLVGLLSHNVSPLFAPRVRPFARFIYIRNIHPGRWHEDHILSVSRIFGPDLFLDSSLLTTSQLHDRRLIPRTEKMRPVFYCTALVPHIKAV
jgi:hypothetical protein